ncbi:MAG: S8 family serine peptidase [Holophagales bacterium]|jgi:hypothetical protein|nr:S8 family serine peptidase [Holophagales bacterium]
MKFSCAKYCTLALASVLALGLGCNSTDPQDSGGGGDITPPKEIPVVNNPVVKYNFYEPKSEEGLMKDTNYGYLIAKVRPGFKKAWFESLGFKIVGSIAAEGGVYYRLYKESDVLPALNRAKIHNGVMFIEPDIPRELHAPVTFNNPDQYLVTNELYGVKSIKAYDAWLKHGFGPNKPIIASVDTGVRWRHEDLVGQIKHAFTWWLPTSGTNWTTLATVDGSIPLDSPRIMALLPDMTKPYEGVTYYSTDHEAHGTHTSGTMVAKGNNGVGIAGVCWNAELIHYKSFSSSGNAYNWTVLGSIWHLARWKEANNYTATIPVNCSIGGPYASQFEIDMIAHGLKNGIILVASSGNNGQRMVNYPAAYSGVITVGATTGADKLVNFSDWGPHLSVVAPGSEIYSTVHTTTNTTVLDENSAYDVYDGTSMAAPHVTGLIGYMLNFNPNLRPDQIKTLIEQNADYIDGQTGFSEKTGWGRINVLKTIEAVMNNAAPPSNYTMNPVKIKAPSFANESAVYLYNCSADGTIENYVASSYVGQYLANMEPGNDDFTRENDVAYFNMLRAGRYVAKAFLAGAVATTDVFEVAANSPVIEKELAFSAEVLFRTVQTFYTQDAKGKTIDLNNPTYTDTCIVLYDGVGNYLWEEDYWLMDSYRFPVFSGDAYYVLIYDFNGAANAGEYAMYLTGGQPWTPGGEPGQGTEWILEDLRPFGVNEYVYIPIAPGSYANPGTGVRSAHATTGGAAQTVSLDTIYYGRFNDSAGTSGATGHYYKFSVE